MSHKPFRPKNDQPLVGTINYIDTHAHLFFPSFAPDLDLVLERAIKSEVATIINVGDDLKTSQEALEQAIKIKTQSLIIYSTIGSHPHEVSKLLTPEAIQQNMEELEKVYQQDPKKVVAVGECGLDFFFGGGDYNLSNAKISSSAYIPSTLSQEQIVKLQKQLLLAHITIAKKLDLPLVIHCRDAWHEIFIPELQGSRGVFHSFTGNKDSAQKALDLGYYLGFSCMVTYPKNEALRQIIKDIPLDKILAETDSPFLPPQSIRGQRNEPANVAEVVKVISQVKNISEDEVTQKVLENALRLFDLN